MNYLRKQTIEALDTLVEYPELSEYIKSFEGDGGFMYTIETDETRKALSNKLGDVLDSNGMHSGASWGCMLRSVQAVLSGHITREKILQDIEIEEHRQQELREQREAEQCKAEQCKAEQCKTEQKKETPGLCCYGALDVSALSEEDLQIYKKFVIEDDNTAADFVIWRYPELFEYISNNSVTINASDDQPEETFPGVVIIFENKNPYLYNNK